MKIQIVSTQLMKPSSPTPSHHTDFKLSFIDERIPPAYGSLILYYSFSEDKRINQSEMCRRLKNSLPDALVQYYPLAGRTKGQFLVDCNDQGILFVEANANSKISDITNSGELTAIDKLIPSLTVGQVTTAEELLAVQITSFNCGGITVGICISHRIVDHLSLSSFIKCWAAVACGDQTNVVSPVFNAAALFPPRNTPDFRPNLRSLSVQPQSVKVVTERFVFAPSAINAMKLQAVQNSSIVKPTRVEVITAFLWRRCMVAKGLKKSDRSIAYHPVSLRGKIPELTENSFGNLFQMICAESDGEGNWTRMVEKLRAAIEKIDREYVKKLLGGNGFELARENFMGISKYLGLGNVAVFRFSSACRSPVYEADFGWGKPVWVSSAGYRNRDMIFLFDSVEKAGGIEAWILMEDRDMERLRRDPELQRLASRFTNSRL